MISAINSSLVFLGVVLSFLACLVGTAVCRAQDVQVMFE